jgi:hypothetical protein
MLLELKVSFRFAPRKASRGADPPRFDTRFAANIIVMENPNDCVLLGLAQQQAGRTSCIPSAVLL